MEETRQEIAGDIAQMIATAPEPTEKTPEQITTAPEPQAKPTEPQATEQAKRIWKIKPEHGRTDPDGFLFDARLHARNKDGTPKTWPDGKFLQRHKGWKNGMVQVLLEMEREKIEEKQHLNVETEQAQEPKLKPLDGDEQSSEENAPMEKTGLENVKAVASLVVDYLWIGAGYKSFGKEWLPHKISNDKTERDYLIELWEKALSENETIREMPNSLALVLAHSTYLSTRLFVEESNTLKKIRGWIGKFRKKEIVIEKNEQKKEAA